MKLTATQQLLFITGSGTFSRHLRAGKSISTANGRRKVSRARYQPIMARIKKFEGSTGHADLATTLSELTLETLHIVERLNAVVNIRLEEKYGRELFGGGHSILETKLLLWIPGHFNLFLRCATELAWAIDNFNCLGANNIALSSDTMNGFFIGPRSAAQLVEHLLACVCCPTSDTESARNCKDKLLSETTAMRFERHERLVRQPGRSQNCLIKASCVLDKLGEGLYDLRGLLGDLDIPSLEISCREALLITAAARKGMTLIGEEQLVSYAKLLDRENGAMSGTKIVCPGIVPRRLWDCLLPYVTVDKHGRTLRGTMDQVDWLVTHSYSGVAAGFSRLYGSRVSINDVSAPLGTVREGHRPTVNSFGASDMATLQWLMSIESPLEHTYHKLREIAQRGESPRGRSCAQEWLSLYHHLWSVNPQFADGHFSASMSVGVMSLIAAASQTVADFREGLWTRIVATFSCEDCRIETPDGDYILTSRDDEGNVTISSTGTRSGALLMMTAGRIQSHCVSRGTKVKSDLGFEQVERSIPDFVGMGGEAYTPAAWINLVDIKIP